MIPTLLPLVVPEIIIMTTYGAINDGKVGIIMILGIQCGWISLVIVHFIYNITLRQWAHIDGLVQERCNSIANALELRLSCTKPTICDDNMFDAILLSDNLQHFHQIVFFRTSNTYNHIFRLLRLNFWMKGQRVILKFHPAV